MNYQIVFSIEGLINEYVEPARVIRNGRIQSVESMTEIESLQFPAPFGDLEAFHTSGGSSTLPESFLGRVQTLDYKTIRYPGHCRQFRLLIDLGLTGEKPIAVNGVAIAPRRLLAELLQRQLPADEPDVVLVRVEFKGRCGNVIRHTAYDIIDRFDEPTGLSAMMRTTAFPTSIVAQMMGRGEITARGATTLERSVPTQLFLKALAKRGIQVQKRVTENPAA
jgi:lysine 6-dehydrogenase